MRGDDFLTGFLMALALSFGAGYVAGLISGWFGHRWHIGRDVPDAEPLPMPGYGAAYDAGGALDDLRGIEAVIERELLATDFDDVAYGKLMALREHSDATTAHQVITSNGHADF